MYKTLSQITETVAYTSNKCRFANILKDIQKLNIDDPELNTESHMRCNFAKDNVFCKGMRDDLIILQVPISLSDILPENASSKFNNEKIGDLDCGRFMNIKGYKFRYEYLSENIKYWVSMKKKIFIMFIFQEYCVVKGKDNRGKKLEYSTHSTCLFMIPNESREVKNSYDAFYINSHGRDMQDTNIFKRIASRKRTYNINFYIPVELLLIENLIDYWNENGDYNGNKLNIYWDDTEKHTYLNSNLQAGDNYGLCFAFPQIIFHHFGEFYDKSQKISTEWGDIIINSGEKLLKCGKLAIFVKSAFVNYSKKYKNKFIETTITNNYFDECENDILEMVLLQDNTIFLKKMMFYLTNYIKKLEIKNIKI